MIEPHENELIGKWNILSGKAIADEICNRIQQLISNYLHKVKTNSKSGGWEVLYVDHKDGRYWELTYPKGEMHGGGPPRLKAISRGEAVAKYGNIDG